ncbi:hypothetical protein PSFL_24390 [Pseudomonas sp. DD1]
MDVLHHHNRIVHHKTHGNHDGHQGQVVQTEAHHIHQGKSGHQRHPQHTGDNQGCRPLAQEQRHHRHHQQHRDQQGDFHFMQRGTNGLGAIRQRADFHRRRQHRLQARQLGLDAVHGVDDIGPRLAENHQVDPRCITGPGLHVGVFRTVDHPCHVAQLHRRAVLVGNNQLAVFLRMKQLIVGRQRRYAVAPIQRALGQVQARLLQHQADIGQGQADGGEFVRRGLYPDCRALLAGDADLADAVDLADLPGQQGLHVVAQFGAGHIVGADAEDQHRAVRRVDLTPGRQVGHIAGQFAGRRIDRRLHFLGGGVDALVEGELQGQQAGAQGAAGGHLGHAGDGTELHFQGRGHRRGHGVGAGAGQLGGDLDRRELRLRQWRDGQAREGDQAQQHQGKGQQQGGDRMVDAPGRY